MKAYLNETLFLLIIILIFLASACSLERTNPLDPKSNPNVTIPPTPVIISSETVGRDIELIWYRTEEIPHLIHHYNIYRSGSDRGPFRFIRTVYVTEESGETMEYTDSFQIVSGLNYFYKVSAVTHPVEGTVPPRGLEGRLSDHCGGVRAGGN